VTVRRLLGLLAGRRSWIAGGALLAAAAVGSNVALMATSAYLISKAALATNVADLALAITAVRVLAIARAAFRYLERYVTHAATFRILADLRVWFYAAIEPLAPARLVDRRSGDLLARVGADVDTLEDFPVRVVVPPLAAVVVTAATCLFLGAFDPGLVVVFVLFVLMTGVVLPIASRRLSVGAGSELIARRADLQAAIVDEVAGLADLVALDQADGHRAGLLVVGREVDRVGERLAMLRAATAALGGLFAGLCGVAILAVAIQLVTDGRLDGVLLAALPLAAIAAFEAVQPLALSVQLLGTSEAAGARLFELVDAPPPVTEPTSPSKLPSSRAIKLREVRYQYEPGAPEVLAGVGLDVADGERVAIVGASGAGKSTLVDLLVRFREAEGGTIAVGGEDIRDLPSDDVRALFGVVPQRIHLFNGTVRDNLALADADVSDADLEAALRIVQLDEFVAGLPRGVDTPVGEDGLQLSGGQRQRLAIARAIIRDAPILILDEPTSALDPDTEARLFDALAGFMAGRTTIVISHRAAVADRVDRVLELRDGRLWPAGSLREAVVPLSGASSNPG
jgi:ATP-binding cassette, subfamily C, bacterial CydC